MPERVRNSPTSSAECADDHQGLERPQKLVQVSAQREIEFSSHNCADVTLCEAVPEIDRIRMQRLPQDEKRRARIHDTIRHIIDLNMI